MFKSEFVWQIKSRKRSESGPNYRHKRTGCKEVVPTKVNPNKAPNLIRNAKSIGIAKKEIKSFCKKISPSDLTHVSFSHS